jgi:hypothetical protein
MEQEVILSAIGSTEASTFSEFCRALKDDCPEKGDTAGWRELFGSLEWAEHQGLIEIDRVNRKIDSLILTEKGAALVRDRLDADKGLLSMMR